jgi:hypothetical protein
LSSEEKELFTLPLNERTHLVSSNVLKAVESVTKSINEKENGRAASQVIEAYRRLLSASIAQPYDASLENRISPTHAIAKETAKKLNLAAPILLDRPNVLIDYDQNGNGIWALQEAEGCLDPKTIVDLMKLEGQK